VKVCKSIGTLSENYETELVNWTMCQSHEAVLVAGRCARVVQLY
jgi:hypothetical protein